MEPLLGCLERKSADFRLASLHSQYGSTESLGPGPGHDDAIAHLDRFNEQLYQLMMKLCVEDPQKEIDSSWFAKFGLEGLGGETLAKLKTKCCAGSNELYEITRVLAGTKMMYDKYSVNQASVPPVYVAEYARTDTKWLGFQHLKTYEDRKKFYFTTLASENVPSARWISVTGLNKQVVRELGLRYHMHTVDIKNALKVDCKAMIDNCAAGQFVVLPVLKLRYNTHDDSASTIDARWFSIQSEAVRIFVVSRENTLITIEQSKSDMWDSVRHRINVAWSATRKKDNDFLLCCLLHAVVNAWNLVIDQIEGCINGLKHQLDVVKLKDFDIDAVHNVKQELSSAYRILKHNRAVLDGLIPSRMEEMSEKKISERDLKDNIRHFRDIQTNFSQVFEDIENGVSICLEVIEEYASKVANVNSEVTAKQGKVMFVLTCVTVQLAPITILAGIYGMNFDQDSEYNLPELRWEYGYVWWWVVVIIVEVLTAVVLRWLGLYEFKEFFVTRKQSMPPPHKDIRPEYAHEHQESSANSYVSITGPA